MKTRRPNMEWSDVNKSMEWSELHCTGRAKRKIRANQAEEAKAVYPYLSYPRLYVPRVDC